MATKKNSSAKSPQATSRSNRDSMRWILGLLLLFAGLFLTASVLFYYFDWRADMRIPAWQTCRMRSRIPAVTPGLGWPSVWWGVRSACSVSFCP